jgi:hypothetical protein
MQLISGTPDLKSQYAPSIEVAGSHLGMFVYATPSELCAGEELLTMATCPAGPSKHNYSTSLAHLWHLLIVARLSKLCG